MSAPSVELSGLPPEIPRALREAFGDATIEDLALVRGGRSGAILLSFTVRGAGYVLRRSEPSRPDHERRSARELACMRIASDRGVAPRLRYVDEATSVAIMDRVDVPPSPPGSPRIERIATALRRLHEGPAFPRGTGIMGLLHGVHDLLRARGAGGLPEPLVRTMRELAEVTERFAHAAPCHGDLNPGNVLEAPDAVYFVDWEMAAASDPFLDLAQLGVFSFSLPEQRDELLERYLGRRPDEEERARATIARVMALGGYAAAFYYAGVLAPAGSPAPTAADPLPMRDLLALLAAARERASADVVAASLLHEMRREEATDAFAAAKRALAA